MFITDGEKHLNYVDNCRNEYWIENLGKNPDFFWYKTTLNQLKFKKKTSFKNDKLY